MGNAIWLFFALPKWYFSSILMFPTGEPLLAVPQFGIVCLVAGVILGVIQRKPNLLLFLIMPAASQGLVVVAGFMRGMLQRDSSEAILARFLLLQILAAGYLVYRLKGARLSASALALFSLSYALFASFVATMAFQDVWL